MLKRTAIAAAAVVAAFTATIPAARADFATMAAHNYEIVMRGVQRQGPKAHRATPVRQVMRGLSRRGYYNFRVLRSRPGVYRIHCYRNGRPYVVTTAAQSGRILKVSRG